MAATTSRATGVITKIVNSSARPVTNRSGGACGAPSALRRSDITTDVFTNADSIIAKSGTAATATSAAALLPVTTSPMAPAGAAAPTPPPPAPRTAAPPPPRSA